MSEYLLVPTNIQAFLVGKTSNEEIYDLVLVPRGKNELLDWYFEKRYFFAFDQQSKIKPLERGIHLHWALPAALTRSRHYRRDNHDVHEQPFIPNRWLVLRMWRSEENREISSKAWVIESDFLSDKSQPDSTPFLIQSPALEVKFAGHKTPLENWAENATKYRFDLKSSGWGDPSFYSYYPACRGVLGFHDDLLDVNDGNLLTYLVLGWYSEPEKDPLCQAATPENSKKILHDLLWSCSEPKSGSLSQRTLCHGSVVGIRWNKDAFYEKVFDGSKAEIAIGSSVDDAFAALLTKDEQQQQVLRAFYYGRADDVNNEYQLAELLHHQSFNTIPGGKRWSLESLPQSSEKHSTRPLVSARVSADLAELNQAQQRLDKCEREIESYRWQLFAGWVAWIWQRVRKPEDLNPGMQNLRGAESGLQALKNEVTDWKGKVIQALKTEGLQITESTMPPFYVAKDPVVVLKGNGVAGIDRTNPRRPDKDKDDERVLLLHCRHSTEVVSKVSLSRGKLRVVEASSLQLSFPGSVGSSLNELARKLAQESLLFDPNYLDLVAEEDDPVRRAVEDLQKTLDQRSDSGNVEWEGTPPDPLGVTRWLGADPPYATRINPWLPVFLLWQADWTYAHAKDSGMREALKGWTLAANSLGGDLAPDPKQKMVRESTVTPGNATLVSVASGQQIAEKLEIFARSQELTTKNLSLVRDTTVLSQSLGGFNELLLRQTMGLFLPPLKPKERKAAVIDDEIWNALGRAPQALMPAPSGRFLPVRSGDLKFVNLCAVDTFGQRWQPVTRSSGCPITASAAVRPKKGDDSHARFSPGLAQPARLHFDWHVDGKDASACGPLCGWLVPNFLDRSFSVFDASGVPLGALESVLNAFGERTSESKVKFRWRSAPGSDVLPAGITNSHLRRLVTLIASDQFTVDEGRAFLELVEIILRKREERRPLDDPRLAVLLGRPLAVLQVSIKFELQGLPAGYFKTVTPWAFETDGLESLRVPVALGGIHLAADGLVGYLDEKAGTFFATSGATQRVENSPRIQYSQPLEVSAADQPKILTLLLDATARVHATTGILPRCSTELPPEIAKQIQRIEHIYFKAAPVLGARPEEKAPMYMPHPSDAFGRWSWSTRPALGWREIQPADDRASFSDDLALCEGWLKLNLRSDERGAGKETN